MESTKIESYRMFGVFSDKRFWQMPKVLLLMFFKVLVVSFKNIHIYITMFSPLRSALKPFHFFILFLLVAGIHCGTSSLDVILYHKDMRDYHQLRREQDSTVLVMAGNGDVFTRPIQLKKGKYSIVFRADGNIANKELPHFIIRFGQAVIKETYIKEKVNRYIFNFELPEAATEPLQFTFDNDYNDASGDRNVFLYYPIEVKPYHLF